MFGKKNSEDKKIDYKKLNDVIGLTKKILKITYILVVIIGIYAITLIFKEWNIMKFLKTFLTIVSPFFIGVAIAWLFDPFVRLLKNKGIKRTLGAILTYVLFIGGFLIILSLIIPLLGNQINDFANSIPTIFETIKGWIDGIFDNFANIKNFDVEAVKAELFMKIEDFGLNLTESLPELLVNFIRSLFSGFGIFLVGIVIGFYLIISFDNVNESIITFLPSRTRDTARDLMNEINIVLRRFVQGTLLSAAVVFIATTIGLTLSGMKAPLLFGLFCGITNIIPFIGPYLGGIPAVVVAFSQNLTTGIIVLIVIVIIQFLEGNFFQPLILSKTMKLHPVTIILSLLVFGYFWGIVGMVLATPIVGAIKSILMFFDERYDILNFDN
ncbi:MAG: AI-2E family transporter [Mollicutes bacterium]|nr:AI-2E family transporter [Mollicutes bacterium]